MFRSLLVLVIAAMSNLASADVRGRWSGTIETNGSRIGVVVTLSQHGEELSGAVATSDNTNPAPIEKAEIQADSVTFEVHDGANRIVRFRLALTDGLMSGEVSVGDRTGNRHAEAISFEILANLLSQEIRDPILPKVRPSKKGNSRRQENPRHAQPKA